MRVRVPATSANLGPGFDTLGMALKFYNHFEATSAETLTVVAGLGTCVPLGDMPMDAERNLLAQAYRAYFDFRKSPLIPATLTIDAHIPLSRGLGSSSTAIVAGLVLANGLHPEPLPKEALAAWATELEGHPDNVVPALLGGVRSCLGTTHSLRVRWPEPWGLVVVIPPTAVSTHDAREIMPKTYSREDIVTTLQGAASWMLAAERADSDLMRAILASDRIHEPYRKQLIPEYETLRSLVTAETALGVTISGSGSTLLVTTPSLEAAKALQGTLAKPQSPLAHCRVLSLQPDEEGAFITHP